MPNIMDRLEDLWPLMQQAEAFLPRRNPTFRNPPFHSADFRILILRLSPLHDVDRSTPHLFLFQALRQALPDAYVDLAFFPARYDRERLEAAGLPLLFGTQSFRPAQDFDLVLISNAYILELINLPYLLYRAAVPVMASQRDEIWPPLILGGSNALVTQAIVTETGDSVVDGIFFGEGEGPVGKLARYLADHAAKPKHARLACAAEEVTGLWVAGAWPAQPVEKAVLDAPGGEDLLVDYPLLNTPEAGTARVQINFGCPAFCSFCFEGYDRKPYREVPTAEVLEAARELKQAQGCEKLEIYSFNFNTHTGILTLLQELNELFDRVSVTSQRLDILHHTPYLLKAEVTADKRSFTLGLEGISKRMRAWLHKSLVTSDILALLDRLLQQKVREIKLFYILTGHETADDVAEFRDFVTQLKALRRRHNPGIRVVFSAGWLVRMPFTPLRYDRLFLDPGEWRQIVGPVKSACETNGFEFRMAVEWDDYCVSQVLALGGYWLHEIVLSLAREGLCYDEQLPEGYWDRLREWMVDRGYWNPAFLGEKGEGYDFPFSFVRSRVRDQFLYRKYQRAKAGFDDGYCLGTRDAPGHCLGCGACRNDEQCRSLTEHVMRPPNDSRYLARLEERMRSKWRIQPIYVRLDLPSVVTGVESEWMNAWVMRGLLEAFPELTDNLLAARESLFTTRDNAQQYGAWCGETVFGLWAWSPETVVRALEMLEERAPSAFRFLSAVEGFEPGIFQRAQLNLTLPTTYFPAAGNRLRDFLRETYVPCNLRRDGAGYRFELPEKALKKKALFGGRFEEVDGLFTAGLEIGPKFDLLGFLRSFDEPDRYRHAVARFSDLVW